MIGIIGGCGNIGLEAAKILRKQTREQFKIAGHSFTHASSKAKELFKNDEWYQITNGVYSEWENYFKNCSVVLCSATLEDSENEMIDKIAANCKCPLIHLGINIPEKNRNENSCIYGAGSIPGLSGILPWYLAQKFEEVDKVEFYYGAKGGFTATSARDYLQGIYNADNKSMSMWKEGNIVPYETTGKKSDVLERELQGVKFFPYFDKEALCISQELQLKEGRWNMGIFGSRTIKILERVRYDYQANPQKTIEDICVANKLDCFGVKAMTKFVCQISGTVRGIKTEKTIILTCAEPAVLTGSVAAATVLVAKESKRQEGVSLLSDSVIRIKVFQKLLEINPSISIKIIDGLHAEEFEGEI